MKLNPLFAIDFYKVDHKRQYPEGTTEIYSNFTPRSVRPGHHILPDFDNKIVVFGIQYMVKKYLIDFWNDNFFSQPKDLVINNYLMRMHKALGIEDFDTSHLESLHDLGYLPIVVKAIEEGIRIPIGIPVLTIRNTLPEFFWLTNYLETLISSILWKPMTVATTAFEFKRLLTDYAFLTGSPIEFVEFQAHDFSFRGMSGLEDAMICGAAHLTSFKGTDCVPAIDLIQQYYEDGFIMSESPGMSVPATEHSVMCINGEEGEFDTIKRLITEVYPTGIVSVVCDSYNFFDSLTAYIGLLSSEIMVRDGKVVVRPDSGDPLKIICGDNKASGLEKCGALRILWSIFGGTVNDRGYKVLDPHIGLIYGDAITVHVANEILETMEKMGFASCNIVFGVGSYSYQYITRDTFGFAMKATSAVINGERRSIFKNPVTSSDSTPKKSAKGLLSVYFDDNLEYQLIEDCPESQENCGHLRTVFYEGEQTNQHVFDDIRENLAIELSEI